MNLKKVGVIGAGVMGVGVAQCFAQNGFEVVLVDISEEILENARERIINNIRFQMLFNKSNSTDTDEDVMKRIKLSVGCEHLRDVDFVVENVTEKWEIKKAVYKEIDHICKEHVVFAVNTSAISITKVASVTKRPTQVLGMHFMNPVPLKPVVETIRGYHTSDETIKIAKDLMGAIGKECIVVNDSPGFVSNRVLMLTVNEAVFLIADQVAEAEDVDRIFKTCFGHKMGPLETADMIGLDTILYSLEVLYESYNDPKFRPCPLLKKMVDAGLYGMKNGKGFYSYS